VKPQLPCDQDYETESNHRNCRELPDRDERYTADKPGYQSGASAAHDDGTGGDQGEIPVMHR